MNLRTAWLAAAAASLPLHAAEPPQLEPVVVTATRSEQPVNRLPAALVVITRDEIERSGAAHLADVLRGRAGVEVIDTFGDGSRTLVGLRGFGENAHSNTLILVNGRRLNNPDMGAPDLSAIALQDVERIEIVQGSLGALLGDQAVGGVINIITRAPEGEAALASSGGSYALATVRGVAGGRWGAGGARIAAVARRTDNYREHNALEHENLSARGDYDYAEGSGVFVELQHADERLQTPGALLEPEVAADRRQAFADFGSDFSDTTTTAATAGLRQALGGQWAAAAELSQRESDGMFRLSFRAAPATSDGTQDRRIFGFTPRVSGQVPLAGSVLVATIGVDAQRADYHLLSSIGPQANDQTLLESYAQVVAPLGAGFEAAVGGRVGTVENELVDNFVFPSGGVIEDTEDALALGLAWRATNGLRVFARFDENYRFPKTDEYFGSTFTPGIVDLHTQTGESWEAGTEWRSANLRVTALLYRLDLQDEVVFDPTTFLNANLDETRRLGAMLESAMLLTERLEIAASYTYVDAEVRSGSLAGKAVPLVARHVGRAAVTLSPTRELHLSADVQGAGARAFAGDFDNSLAKLPGYAIVGATAQYRPGRWHVELRLNNLLDKEYTELGAERFTGEPTYFPSPEFNARVGAGLEF